MPLNTQQLASKDGVNSKSIAICLIANFMLLVSTPTCSPKKGLDKDFFFLRRKNFKVSKMLLFID